MRFDFANDDKSQAFCSEIVNHLIMRHHMTPGDAQHYVALQWSGQPFEGSYDMRYHRLSEEWADHIYSNHDYLFGSMKPSPLC